MRIRRRSEIRIRKERLPLLAATFLFLAACLCLYLYVNSSQKQAGRILEKIYTADSSWISGAADDDRLEELYSERLGSLATDSGLERIKNLRLPYGLAEKPRTVEKTYAELSLLGQDQNGQAKYAYEIQVEFYYDKGIEVMQPVETEYYSGSVEMKKTGLFRWKLDQISAVRIR